MSMNRTRSASWANCGIDISSANSVQEAIRLSGLDYEVVKEPIYLADGTQVPEKFCTKHSGKNEFFGIVGNDYTIVQNSEAFSFIDEMKVEGLKFTKAGETQKFNWVLAQLPEEEILGDKFAPYIIFQNSHSGGTALRACVSYLRFFCQNQFSLAFKNSDNKVSLRHTASIPERMHSAQQVLGLAAKNMVMLKKKAEVLALEKVNRNQGNLLLQEVFPISEDMTERKAEQVMQDRRDFMKAYKQDDIEEFRSTKWGLLNAYSDFITHKEPMRKTETAEQNKFIDITVNTSLMDNFMTILERI